jgi:hypothetical protein
MDPRPHSTPQPPRRRRQLIKPSLQVRFGLIFAGLTALSLTLQGLLFGSMVVGVAERMPAGGEYLLELLPGMMERSIVFALLIAVPLTVLVGIHATFPVVGPLYRIEGFLREVVRGERTEPCRIREGDDLGELCDLVNQATEPLRQAPAELDRAA